MIKHMLLCFLSDIKLTRGASPKISSVYGEEAQRAFLTQLRHLQGSEAAMQLPAVPAWKEYEKTLWVEGRTPYMDAIELMDYIAAEGEG